MKNLYSTFLFAVMMSAGSLSAQEVSKESEQIDPTIQTVAFNPIFAPLGTMTAEYEQAIAHGFSLGISGWYEYDNVRARWIYLKGMYYFSEKDLDGFAAGITFGVIRSYRNKNNTGQHPQDETPIAGTMIHYNWFIGSDRTILIGTGIGARVATKQFNSNSPLRRFDGDVRLVLGLKI